MLATLRGSTDTADEGFTLVELLLIIAILGILAGIAIPVLLGQRKKGIEASMKTDLRTIATTMETYYVDHQAYPAIPVSSGSIEVGESTITLSGRNNATVTTAVTEGTASFCVAITNPDVGGGVADAGWFFNSAKGGIRPQGEGCG